VFLVDLGQELLIANTRDSVLNTYTKDYYPAIVVLDLRLLDIYLLSN
jgi:hypothetical protein